MTWRWPLPGVEPSLPPDGPLAFCAARDGEVHTGLDLVCAEGQPVAAVEDGIVLANAAFTGTAAGSPTLYPSRALMVLGESGVVLYGEVWPWDCARRGARVLAGQTVAEVVAVRGAGQPRPWSMLHLERWRDRDSALARYLGPAARDPVDWRLGAPQPDGLLDPTDMLCGLLDLRDVAR